jgi:hypothetical protein
MRRLAFIFAASAALVAPAATLAVIQATGDGSLVVRNGSAPWNVPGEPEVPVVAMVITGSVIGRVTDAGKIIIDPGANPSPDSLPQVIGAGKALDVKGSDSASMWIGSDFTFRAVGGKFTILVYGSHVNLVAAGTGKARVAGMPDTPTGDGKYSLNDSDFRSLPGTQTAKLLIGTSG